MKKTIEVIQRIEGEAELKLFWKREVVEYAQIEFLNFRGFEKILQNKPALDALILTPRVCGICGQAHLMATVKALENLYEKSGYMLEISQKAKAIRQIALNFEIISSHLKWFYLFILPDILQTKGINNNVLENDFAKLAIRYASEALRAIAIFAGQWPHASFALPGGVVSDPTSFEISLANDCLESVERFFCTRVFDPEVCFEAQKGDFALFFEHAMQLGLDKIGKSYNRLLSFSDSTFDPARLTSTNDLYSYSRSSTIVYDGLFFETGPLARMVQSRDSNIQNLYAQFQDSALTRISARILEVNTVIYQTKQLLCSIDIREPSYIKPKIEIAKIDSVEGVGIVEASRGSLMHQVKLEHGFIQTYHMTTPTACNLGPGDKKNLSTAQKALVGVSSQELAKLVLRSFDVCAVCTTH